MFGVTMLYISVTSRIESYIKMLSVQGVILFIISIIDFNYEFDLHFVLVIIETLLVKTILIPLFLIKVVRKNNIYREIEPYISNFYSIVICSIIFICGFLLSYWISDITLNINSLYFGFSMSTIVTGLFVIMTRKKIITHVMGYIILENGIFLMTLSIAYKIPFIVSLGILLDIFIAVFLLGIFVNRIHNTFHDIEVDKLTNLRD